MAIISLDEVTPLDQHDIASDPRTTTRRSEWYNHMEAVVGRYQSGEFAADKFVKLADFGAASGARVKMRQLCQRNLPGNGVWYFQTATWLGEDGKRHSSLFARYADADADL